jgi:hypothetical protein
LRWRRKNWTSYDRRDFDDMKNATTQQQTMLVRFDGRLSFRQKRLALLIVDFNMAYLVPASFYTRKPRMQP